MTRSMRRPLRAAIGRVFGLSQRDAWDARLDEETRLHIDTAAERFAG